MPLPNGAGGYQFSDGNVGEPLLIVQTTPTALTAAATLTAAQLGIGLFTYNGAAANLTLPTVADLEAFVSSGEKVDVAFEFYIINTGANTATLVVNTGWTIVGAAGTATATSSQWRARKTGVGAWTCYRVS
jgi:enolase